VRSEPDRCSDSQRALRWLMAIRVLTLKPRFPTSIAIRKPLGIAIVALTVLRLGVRWGLSHLHDLTIYRWFRRWQQSSRMLCSTPS
jgi:hypothetical protein